MKVNAIKKGTNAASKVTKALPSVGSKFTDLLDDHSERNTKEQLEKMMLAIRKQGDQLVEAKNIEVLVQYKRMVKEFVSQAVDFAFEIQERKGLSRMGRSKVLKVVAQIDESLIAITDSFIAEERSRIKLLSKIGELQGLLMNLYV
jgi:uncharacterized protein YaaR (DUF327 family)